LDQGFDTGTLLPQSIIYASGFRRWKFVPLGSGCFYDGSLGNCPKRSQKIVSTLRKCRRCPA
jgi:hypothetical protein